MDREKKRKREREYEKTEKRKLYKAKWIEENKDKVKGYSKKWRDANQEKYKEALQNYRNSKIGRATNLLKDYNRHDVEMNRGVGDLTPEWIVENILDKKCSHCDEADWHNIGCNRLDNSKPHTKDNVEPCCLKCNVKLAGDYNKERASKKVDQIDSVTGEVIKTWDSMSDTKSIGYSPGSICMCCNGGYFDKRTNKWVNVYKYKGYVWRRHT